MSRRKVGKQIIAVALATPSPIDVIVEVAVVAIADKSVASLRVSAAEVEGTTVGQFVVAYFIPSLVDVVALLNILHRRTVAEVGPQRLCHTVGIGSGGGIGVVHLHRHTTVEHQIGNGLTLHSSLTAVVVVAHVCPVDGCTFWNTINMQLSVDGMLRRSHIGWNGCQRAIGRLVTLVVHDLCHCRSHTTRHRAPQTEIVWTVLVVGVALVPSACHELCNLRMFLHSLGDGLRMLPEVDNLVLILSQQRLHIVGRLRIVERTFVAITQHRLGLIVARNNDESFAIAAVEDIVWIDIRDLKRSAAPRRQLLTVDNGR